MSELKALQQKIDAFKTVEEFPTVGAEEGSMAVRIEKSMNELEKIDAGTMGLQTRGL